MIQDSEPFIETYSGKRMYFLDPRPEDICIEDIAHALSNKCRFAGHCSSFYSVAEHSLIVSLLVEPDLALTALMHDAAEAYLEDIPSPIKPYFKEYKEMERNIMEVLASKFEFQFPEPDEVKEADKVQLVSEARHLMPSRGADYPQVPGRTGKKPKCLYPHLAEEVFLERFYELRNEQPIGRSLIVAAK
jgi:hypothetical protein